MIQLKKQLRCLKLKIAIYKPLKKIFWDLKNDYNVWSREIVGFSKMMADKGHEIYFLTDNDYDGSYKNIYNYQEKEFERETVFDVLVVFNGAFSLQEETEDNMFDKYSFNKSVLIASDYDLAVNEHDSKKYDIVLTASKDIDGWEYGAVEHYHMYGETMFKGGWEGRKNKGIFVGYDRHKEEKFLEYVMRPEFDFFGKALSLNINKMVLRDEAYSLLTKYVYSIVFFDKRVTDVNFVTARPLELILFGLLPIIDIDYDKGHLQFPKDYPFKVSNYREFLGVKNSIHKKNFLHWQEKLQTWMTENVMNGNEAYKLFLENVE